MLECGKACLNAACRHQNGRIIKRYKLGVDGEAVTIKGHFVKFLDPKYVPGEGIFIWTEEDKETKAELEMKIIAMGEGWPMPDDLILWDYMGSVVDGDNKVWHYYGSVFYNFPNLNDEGHLHEVFFEGEIMQ